MRPALAAEVLLAEEPGVRKDLFDQRRSLGSSNSKELVRGKKVHRPATQRQCAAIPVQDAKDSSRELSHLSHTSTSLNRIKLGFEGIGFAGPARLQAQASHNHVLKMVQGEAQADAQQFHQRQHSLKFELRATDPKVSKA